MSRQDAVSRTPWCLALGLALAWVPSLAAQDAATTPTVEPGDRIRFVAPPRYPSLVESELVSLDAYTLRARALEAPERLYLVPVEEIEALELRTSRSQALMGAAIGTGVGLAGSVLFLSAFCNEGDSPCDGGDYIKGGAIITLPATLGGLFLGSIIRKAEWVPVERGAAEEP